MDELRLNFWLLVLLQAFLSREINSSNHFRNVSQRYTVFTLVLFCCFSLSQSWSGQGIPRQGVLRQTCFSLKCTGEGNLTFRVSFSAAQTVLFVNTMYVLADEIPVSLQSY